MNAMRIAAMDTFAERQGLKRGQGIAEARALCPGIDVVPADPGADQAFLEALADWCDRYTPLVALDGKNGLFLDITGCAHLFGGEKSLLEDVLLRLTRLGVEAWGAITSTPGLSWASARFGSETIIAAEDAERVLVGLPMAALRLERVTIETLERVGLKTVGDILQAPRAPLARRFGSQLLQRLDQALGLEDEPLSPRMPVASLSQERRLAEPIQGEDDIMGLTLQLAGGLKSRLAERGEGGREFELALFRVDGRVFRIAAGTSAPLREPDRICALFRERLQAVHDDLDAGFGFEILRLSVMKTERHDAVQADFSGSKDRNRPLSAFMDRVVARFGPDSLLMPVLVESHVPERASLYLSLQDADRRKPPKLQPEAYVRSARPLRLFSHPELVEAVVAGIPDGAPAGFRWRRIAYRIARSEGPERLEAEWWVDGETAPARDYFRVEDDTGRRFWLFRRGLYGQQAVMPQWFLHGIFA